MLGSLRDKFSHLQEGLVGTITGGEPTTITTPSAQQQLKLAQDKEKRIARQAGGDILFHFQNCWEKLHVGAEQCARQADRCDRLISQVHAEYDKRWRHVAMLSSLVEGLPEMDRNISNIIQELRHMEILFSNVELALQNLEDTIHAQETREKQQQMRFDMRVYEEKRKHELLDLEEHLKKQQQKSLKEAERRENQIKLERQNVFQTKFQEDLKTYQQSGFLDVPLLSHNIDDVTLESINLSGDENELEDFLNSDATDFYNLGRARSPTQNFLSVPDRKRKTLSGPPTVNNSSNNRGQFASGGRSRDVSNDQRYVSNIVRDAQKDARSATNEVRVAATNDVRGGGSAGMTAINLAAEVGTNTVDTLLAAGSIGVDLTAVTLKAAGTVGNVAAGSIGSAAVGLGSAAGTIGYVAADSIGTAAGSIGSAAGSIGYVAADAAGTIGSAAVEMTAATLTVANQGINIGDEILTDAILTAVDENGGNESVIVQPLDSSPTELAITGIDGFVGSNSQEEEERKNLLSCPSSTSKDKLASKKNDTQDTTKNVASNNKTEKDTSNESSSGPTENLQSSIKAGTEKLKSATTIGHVVTVSAVMSDSSGAGSPEEVVDGGEGMVSDSSIYFTPSQTMENINLD